MEPTEQMLAVNRKQADFYDSIHLAESGTGHGGYAENREANLVTRIWAGLRYRQQAAVKEAGIEAQVAQAHEKWARMKRGGDCLELGCFSGSRFTFSLADIAGSYLGVELSAKAVETLNARFAERGLTGKARAQAVDFLALETARKFDLIYAHGVLHHFRHPEPLFEKLAALAAPGALVVFAEPSTINPLYRAIRGAYRPFQSDAGWEWPFTARTVRAMERHFEPVEGFGWGKWSLPLSVLSAMPVLGTIFRAAYVRAVRREVAQGWHGGVWWNSYVTAAYRLRSRP